MYHLRVGEIDKGEENSGIKSIGNTAIRQVTDRRHESYQTEKKVTMMRSGVEN